MIKERELKMDEFDERLLPKPHRRSRKKDYDQYNNHDDKNNSLNSLEICKLIYF